MLGQAKYEQNSNTKCTILNSCMSQWATREQTSFLPSKPLKELRASRL